MPRRTVTREGLETVLADGRWHQTAPQRTAEWFGSDARYEIQYRRLMYAWRAVPASGMPEVPNIRCRIRLRAEHVSAPFSQELQGDLHQRVRHLYDEAQAAIKAAETGVKP